MVFFKLGSGKKAFAALFVDRMSYEDDEFVVGELREICIC
jgi:hypothetical protein